MDKIDYKLLNLLQKDAELSVSDLSDKVGLSRTACWRRLKNLEEDGVIRARVTLLDPASVSLGVTVYALVRTNQHQDAWFDQFKQAIDAVPEVLEFYRMSGDVDYLLKIVARDIGHYDEVYQRLIRSVELLDVSSSFVMETIKHDTALPLEPPA